MVKPSLVRRQKSVRIRPGAPICRWCMSSEYSVPAHKRQWANELKTYLSNKDSSYFAPSRITLSDIKQELEETLHHCGGYIPERVRNIIIEREAKRFVRLAHEPRFVKSVDEFTNILAEINSIKSIGENDHLTEVLMEFHFPSAR